MGSYCNVELPVFELMLIAKVLSDNLNQGMNGELALYNLTITEFKVIRLLLLTDREWTMTELSEELACAPSQISRIANRLVESGLLSRRRLMSDRRVTPLVLTEQGLELATRMHESIKTYESKISQGISAQDLNTCMSVIEKVLSHNRPYSQRRRRQP